MSIKFCHLKEPYGEFGNFYPLSFKVKNKIYKSVEHYYQSKKFTKKTIEDQIINADTPWLAKKIAWKKENYYYIRKDWDDIKVQIMAEGLYHKFTQNEPLKNLLLSTGDAEIIEISSHDKFWGQSSDGEGENKLGKLLMELRSYIKERENKKIKF